MVHKDHASCIQEDYINAKRFFNSNYKKDISKVKWNSKNKSIIVIVPKPKTVLGIFKYTTYEGCDVIYKEPNGRQINISR